MTRADLEAEFHRTLTPHFPGGVPASLVVSLVLSVSGYAATVIEERCRTPEAQTGRGPRVRVPDHHHRPKGNPMSDRFEDREALAAKIEWEGGLMESLDYGIKTEMMPEGDTDLTEAWAKLEDSFRETSKLADVVGELLDARPLSPADTAPGVGEPAP